MGVNSESRGVMMGEVRQETSRKRYTRRDALSTIAKVGAAGIVGLAAGAAAGYFGGQLAVPPEKEVTVTTTVTQAPRTTTVESTVGVPNPYGAPKYKIVAVGMDLAGEFQIPILASIPDTAALYQVDFTYTGAPDVDYAEMHDIARSEVEKKPDGLMFFMMDPTMQELTREALDMGIPTMAFLIDDDPPHESRRMAYIGTDQYSAALQTGRVFLDEYLIPNGVTEGQVAIFTHRPGAPDLEARIRGFSDAVTPAGFAVDVQPAGPEAAQAAEMAEAYMRAHPEVVAAIGVDGISTPSVGRAIDVLGLKDKVFGAGFDLVPRNLEYLQKGTLYAVANQQPYVIFPVAVLSIYMHLVSGKEIFPFDANTGRGVVTTKNLDLFLKKSKFH